MTKETPIELPKDIPVKTAKKAKKIKSFLKPTMELQTKKEIDRFIEPIKEHLKESKKDITDVKITARPKTEIAIQGMPEGLNLNESEGTIELELTEEHAELAIKGLLDTIHLLAPKKFKSPSEANVAALKHPSYIVIKRWMPKLNILKYMPEIVLSSMLIAVLKDMQITEDKKT